MTIRVRPEALPGDQDGTRPLHHHLLRGIVIPSTTGLCVLPISRNGNMHSRSTLMSLTDISRSISPATAVWPGDQPVEWTWTTRMEQESASVNLGAIHLSTHTGTRADAPRYVREEGATTDTLLLSAFVGPARVVDVGNASSLQPEHVDELTAKRVLFKTKASSLSDSEWPTSTVSGPPLWPPLKRRRSDTSPTTVRNWLVPMLPLQIPWIAPLCLPAMPYSIRAL